MSEAPGAEWIVLVGRRDRPTDGVRDYCGFLAEALGRRGIATAAVEMEWATRGWVDAWRGLRGQARGWKGRWVLMQYTPLAWSRRGFPPAAAAVAAMLRRRGARIAVVFHDWTGAGGRRSVDRLRRRCQRWTMRRLAGVADRSIFPAPLENADWLKGVNARAVMIPIGANLPAGTGGEAGGDAGRSGARTVAVYGVTEGAAGRAEAKQIAAAVGKLAGRVPRLRLAVFGRGAAEARAALERELEGSGVELSVRGLLAAEEVARELRGADALLFVRGEILGQRGSAIAGVACGIPVVGYGEAKRAFPVSEGGVVLARRGDAAGLAEGLERILTDGALREELRGRSRQAQREYFSWDRIAGRFAESLNDE